MRYSLLRTRIGPLSRPKKILISPGAEAAGPKGSAFGLVRESRQERQEVLGEPMTLSAVRSACKGENPLCAAFKKAP
jgi:hypothetical protein